MEIISYIIEKALIVIPVLWVIGKIIKSIPKIPDWIIPFALLSAGVPLTMALTGWTVDGAMQGILVTGVAVYGNQVVKQIAKSGESGENNEEE